MLRDTQPIVRGLTRVITAVVAGFALLLSAVASAETANPYTMADETWITISGTVASVSRDSFILDYGDGSVIVEMDDGDRDADAYKLAGGDKVTVSGRVDDDLFETTTIEAASVYVENIGTTFFASPVDEETADSFVALIREPVVVSRVTLQGTVTEVDDDEFTIDSGFRQIRVDVGEMPFNPLDDEGYLKVRVGDLVSVSGEMGSDLFEGRELVADTLMKLDMNSS